MRTLKSSQYDLVTSDFSGLVVFIFLLFLKFLSFFNALIRSVDLCEFSYNPENIE